MYRIGEASRRVGVSPSALRLWEAQGLVRPTRTEGRYRLYSEADLAHLCDVRRMRQIEQVNAPGIRRMLGEAVTSAHDHRHVDGRLLRRLRTRRGISLREASRRSGLSVSFLSAMERGVSGASVSNLQRLTTAYGTNMLELFDAPAGASTVRGRDRVVRADARDALELAGGTVRIEQLARDATRLEPQLFVLSEGATSDGPYAHEGEEFLYLLSGAVTVWVGDAETHQLINEGDALSFPSNVPHRWRNDAAGESRLLWINTPPTF